MRVYEVSDLGEKEQVEQIEKEDELREASQGAPQGGPSPQEGAPLRPEKEVSKRERGFLLSILTFSIAISILSGMASGWYFSRANEREIVVLDVARIVEAKKKEFIEKYRDRGADPKMREEMEREISSFTNGLNRIIEEESRGRIVLVKDSVISETKDITHEVEGKIKGLGDNRAP